MRIFISGPSGVGKSTIISEILKRNEDLTLSISFTTRSPRPNETNGREYFFIPTEEFHKLVQEGVFLEWAFVHERFYGTSLKWVELQEAKGKSILFDIDVQGVQQAREKKSRGIYIFIVPPSIEELRTRLAKRGTEDEQSLNLRLKNSTSELKSWELYDYIVINNTVDRAVDEVQSIIDASRCSRAEIIGRIPWLQKIK